MTDRSWVPGRRTTLVAVAVVAAVVPLTVWFSRSAPAPTAAAAADQRLAGLIAAAGRIRHHHGRITGGFAYAPIVAPRAGSGAGTQGNYRLLAAAGELQQQALSNPGAETLHALGVAQILIGEHNPAVATLADAAIFAPEDARIHADLAVALVARATALGRPGDFAAALSEADQAIAQAPALAEAWFNRALALEGLRLPWEAMRAWEQYLQRDPNGPYADEAGGRHAALTSAAQADADPFRAIVDASVPSSADVVREPSRFRHLAERTLLFGEARCDSRDLAPAFSAYVAATGDQLLRDACLRTRRAPTALLREAHRAYASALAAIDAEDLNRARELLRQSRESFAAADSPFALWSTYHLAALDYLARRYPEAQQRLDAVIAAASHRRYVALLAHAHWTRGVVLAATRQFAASLDEFKPGLSFAERAGERVLAGRLSNQIADIYHYLGLSNDAWVWRGRALDAASRLDSRRLRHSVYGSTATVLLREGRNSAARIVLRAQVEANRSGAPPATRLTLATRLASLALAERDPATAAHHVSEAEAALTNLENDPRADSLRSTVDSIKGRVLLTQSDFEGAARLAGAVIDRAGIGRDVQVADARLLRAQANAALGRWPEAHADVDAVLRVLDQRRETPSAALFSAPDVESLRELLAQLLEQHVERLSVNQALRISQVARVLSSPVPGVVTTIALPSDTAVIAYAVLARRTLVWVITSGGAELVTLPVTRAELAAAVKRLSWTIRARPTASLMESTLASLHDLVFTAARQRVPAHVSSLIVLPDWPLDGVPFAALRHSRTQRHVVEDFTVSLVPHLLAVDRATRTRAVREALVVADPASPVAALLGLARLDGAVTEAARIEAVYRESLVLTGAEAVKTRVLEEAARSRVVHVAAHAVVDGLDGANSQMLLAGDDAESSIVRGAELAASRFSATEAVVLAGCGTAASDLRPHNPMALAIQLLGAGPSAVAGVLWELDDRAAADLFAEVHSRLAEGSSLPEAIRRAQLSQIEAVRRASPEDQANSLVTWAGITVYVLMSRNQESLNAQ